MTYKQIKGIERSVYSDERRAAARVFLNHARVSRLAGWPDNARSALGTALMFLRQADTWERMAREIHPINSPTIRR